MTKEEETEKRRQIQLAFLRLGWTQNEARRAAEDMDFPLTEKGEEVFERMCKEAEHCPQRQIQAPGSIDLYDVKSQREEDEWEAECEVELAKTYELHAFITRLFPDNDMIAPVLRALCFSLQERGLSVLDSLAKIAEIAKFNLKFNTDFPNGLKPMPWEKEK
jgi:hypothetical protein